MVVLAWIFAFIFPPVVPLIIPFTNASARFFSFLLAIVFSCMGWVPGVIYSGFLITAWQSVENEKN